LPQPVRISRRQDDADRLHVEVAHAEEAASGFSDHGEGFDQQVVQGRALGQFFLEPDGFGGEIDIRRGRQPRVIVGFLDQVLGCGSLVVERHATNACSGPSMLVTNTR